MSNTIHSESASENRSCPDEGTCHHFCENGPCFRVLACGPLSGVFPNNRWPEEVVKEQKQLASGE